MHKGSIGSGALRHIDLTIESLERQGAVVIPYYTNVTGDDFIGFKFLTQNGKTIPDVVINFQIMIIDHESLKPKYQKLNVPILHALGYDGDYEEWEKSVSGSPSSMLPMSYIIPETLGYTDPLIVSYFSKKTKTTEPIKEQIASLVNKAINMCKLKNAPNKDKKVAVLFYNYPPGVNNMGSSFMNIPRSLELLFSNFIKYGYTTEAKDRAWFEKEATKTLKYYYEKRALDDKTALLYSVQKYEKFLKTLPKKISDNITQKWGDPSSSSMVVTKNGRKYFLIPAIRLGNIIVMPQPRRADKNDKSDKNADASLWHNAQIEVNHSYLASYLYLKDEFKTDAIIHFGTHGTQEWTPGKERGLSVYESPYIVLGDIPIFYPYITNNVAEGLQAKRRGRATLISHQTPPFSIGGTYNELSKIMQTIKEYKTVDDGVVKETLKKTIKQECINANIHKDVDHTAQKIDDDFEGFLSKVEDYILGASATAQPLGMHTFGTYPKEEHLITTLMQMVGKEFLKLADGERYSDKDYKEINGSNAYKMVKRFVVDGEDISNAKEDYSPFLLKAREYLAAFKSQKETINLFRALSGEYIQTGTGGDLVRNPETLPTGVNLYGFDPNKVPTKSAYKTGEGLMRDFIENYRKENGEYPKKLTFNLWSLETMCHHGVLESEILYAMGVRPIWNETGLSREHIQNIALPILKNYLPDFLAKALTSLITLSRIEFVLDLLPQSVSAKPKKMIAHAKSVNKGEIIDVEIIPYSELKRPRIDTVISVTGLYRDTFGQTMLLIAKAVEKVAALKEENNFVHINSEYTKRGLLEQNMSEKDAKTYSTVRIFSNKSGYYGSGVNKIENTQHFTKDADESIAKGYLKERGYYFGSDEKSWNKRLEGVDLYAKNLSQTDAIIFSRSSNLYGMLTSDDPYGYFGSISLAVRSIDKKSPKTYISNLRDINNPKMQTSAEFMSQELRSRYFHPKWIEEAKAQGYSGTQLALDVINNFWGWQAVDPNVVRDDQWQEFFEIYVKDKYNMKLKEWFESKNPDNLAQIMERMLEAIRLGYWQTDDKTVKELKGRYRELQKLYSVKTNNEKFKELVSNDKSSGFGLSSARVAISKASREGAAKKVEGQKLQKQEPLKEKTRYAEIIMALALVSVVLAGGYYENKRRLT